MRNNVLFTLLHDVWGESASESLRLVMMRLDERYIPNPALFLQAIADYDGAGVAVFIRDSNPAWLSERYGAEPGVDHGANVLRDYGVGAQILLDLGVRDMELLSNSATVLPGSGGYGLRIVGRRALV